MRTLASRAHQIPGRITAAYRPLPFSVEDRRNPVDLDRSVWNVLDPSQDHIDHYDD